MRIKVLARSFFEARLGTIREALLFRKHRIISINSVCFEESPPFHHRFLGRPNLLVLYFDDVKTGRPHAMTDEDALKIVAFIKEPDPRSILIHCTAGVSRSGAIGKVLNWYFNRHLKRNDEDFKRFFIDHPDISPNVWVSQKLLAALIGGRS